MKKERRWLKSAIATSTEIRATMPWARQVRHSPVALKSAPAAKNPAIAAR